MEKTKHFLEKTKHFLGKMLKSIMEKIKQFLGENAKSFLVGLSVLFILIIVIGLFGKIIGNNLLKIEVLNIPIVATELTGINSQCVLYILSPFIALLSGRVVYQKGKENRQKQQKMGEKIKSQEYFLNILYKNLENRGENQ